MSNNNQQNNSLKSPYLSRPNTLQNKKVRHNHSKDVVSPTSYKRHNELYSSINLQRQFYINKPKSKKSSKLSEFYYFNASMNMAEENTKNCLPEPQIANTKQKRSNMVHSSDEICERETPTPPKDPYQRIQSHTRNPSNNSIKISSSNQQLDIKKMAEPDFSSMKAKEQIYYINSKPQVSLKTSINLPDNSPKAAKNVTNQLVGTLSCLRPSESQPRQDRKVQTSIRPREENQKQLSLMFENMKSYVRSQSDQNSRENRVSFVSSTPLDNSREKSYCNISGDVSLCYNIKNMTTYKPLHHHQLQGKNENWGEEREGVLKSIRIQQSLLKNLIEVNTKVSKIASSEEHGNRNIKGKQPLKPYYKPKSGIQNGMRRGQEMKLIGTRFTNIQSSNTQISSFLGPYLDYDRTIDEDEHSALLSDFLNMRETPKGMSGKSWRTKVLGSIKGTSHNNSCVMSKTGSPSLDKLSPRGDLPIIKNTMKGHILKEWKERSLKREHKSLNRTFSVKPKTVLEKELTIQQGGVDDIDGWDDGCKNSPVFFGTLGSKDGNSKEENPF